MSNPSNLSSVFNSAAATGTVSGAGAQALVLAVPDLGAQIQAGLGLSVDDLEASEAVLVTQLVDDSGSIRFVSGNTESMRMGHNLVLDALLATKQQNQILAHTRLLNQGVLYPFIPLAQALKLTTSNYDPSGGTPLYDQSAVTLGTVVAKAQEFADNGVPVRTVTLFATDGADTGSRIRPEDLKKIIDGMLRSEMHIVAGMGIDDGSTDFRAIFTAMGIQPEWILTPGNSPSEIRKAFQVFSQSAVRASQSAAGFSQTAAGGFGSP